MFLSMMSHNDMIVYGIAVVAYLSDIADGWIARRNNEISEWGKIIDPLADKVFVAVCVVALLLDQRMPMWYVAIVLARDFLILIVGVSLRRSIHFVPPSNYLGKATVLLVGFSLLFAYLQVAWLDVYCYAVTAFLAASLIVYAFRAVILLKNSDEQMQ